MVTQTFLYRKVTQKVVVSQLLHYLRLLWFPLIFIALGFQTM